MCRAFGETIGVGVMSFIQYIDKKFTASSLAIIDQANVIIDEMSNDGVYNLSLRQLYYQFVAGDLIANTEKSYKSLGGIITNARLAGLLSWSVIQDRGRTCNNMGYFEESIESVIQGLDDSISFDHWERQENYVEVWIEKDALTNVIQDPCWKHHVRYMACKGYMSASAAWEAGQRFRKAVDKGKNPVLIHLGDHDPSGIDMTRDNQERLELFAGCSIDMRRIALNMDQIDHYAPPPNPTKLSDSRASDYIADYGDSSWELDALKPSVIRNLVSSEIESLVDESIWDDVTEHEEEEQEKLRKLSENWGSVESFLETIND